MAFFRKTICVICILTSVFCFLTVSASALTATTQTPSSGSCVRIRYAYNGKYLDVPAEGINNNGTQLQVWEYAAENENQMFYLNDTGQGWQIVSYQSGKVIEVRDSSHEDYAQIAQWDKHDLACARWDIVRNSDGSVSFCNRESGKFLNVSGGGDAGNGTKIIQYFNDGTAAMKFYIEAVAPAKNVSTVNSGSFVRIRYAGNGKYLDVPSEEVTQNGTQLQIWDFASGNLNQIFQLVDTHQGWQIISLQSGKVVEVRDSSHSDSAQVAQWDKHTLACARWNIIQNSDGTVSFQNRESNLYLNVCGGGDAGNGTKMIQYHDDGTIAMKFDIEAISVNGYTTEAYKISKDQLTSEADLSINDWHPLKGLTNTMLEQDDSLEAIVKDVPISISVIGFILSWVNNSKETTRIHITQGNDNQIAICYGSSFELNMSGKEISLASLLVDRYYNYSPSIIFSSNKKADECIRNWFNVGGSGTYSMNLKFGRVYVGDYGYFLLIENGTFYQVPIIHPNSSYKVYYSENGKPSFVFDAADVLRNAKIRLPDEEASKVLRQLIKNGYIL